MTRLILIPLLALALAGCAGKGALEVKVPIACVSAADVPAKPAPLPARPSDARAALDVALAKLVELLGPWLDGAGGYVGKSHALLRGCSSK